MNQRNKKIEREVAQTLSAFQRTKRLEASPWFAARVRARLRTQPETRTPGGWFAFPRLRPALLGLIVLLNLVTAVVALQRSERNAVARQTYVQSFASEYAYTTTDMLFSLDEP